jgi:hypothetical protein
MSYTIQTFYPAAGLYLNTNHVSEDLDQLKEFSTSEVFACFRICIIDDSGNVVFEPPIRKRGKNLNVSDIANMLNVPIIDLEDLEDLCDK